MLHQRELQADKQQCKVAKHSLKREESGRFKRLTGEKAACAMTSQELPSVCHPGFLSLYLSLLCVKPEQVFYSLISYNGCDT